jgi:uncharacterized membrane protein YbhN (UPF0104 family)
MQSESEKLTDAAPLEIPDSLPVVDLQQPPAESGARRAINKVSEIRHKMPKSVKMQLKILLSVIMFAALPILIKIDPAKTWDAIIHTNVWILSATAALFVSTIVVSARRWQILARAVGFNKPFIQIVEYCYVGMFFNLFLPSTVGGDGTRCYYVSKGTGRYAEALYSVLADRASGLAVLFITAAAGLLLGPGARDLPWQLKWPVFAGSIGLFCVLPFMPVITAKVLGAENGIAKRFNDPRLLVFYKDKKLVASVLGWSCVTQLMTVACHIGVALALGIADKVPLWYYFVFYPCVAVLGFVTPSFNGIGIREWAYTYFLMHTGVDRTSALTYALLWLALTTLLSLVGGLVYAGAKFTPPPKEQD